jgi:hypothetical protein
MSKKYTCDELGTCQHIAECHLPCGGPNGPSRYPFAPGVIDGPAQTNRGHWVADLVAAALALAAVAAVVGFAMGYVRLGVL